MKWHSMQSIIFVNIERNSNCVTVQYVCIICLFAFAAAIAVYVCVQQIFNICHCIHAFALIALQSSTSMHRMYSAFISYLYAPLHIELNRENMILPLFSLSQFFNDYFHFNFHTMRFVFCSSYESMKFIVSNLVMSLE